ncbi:MAG: hypothetical protein GY786_15615 [Proteobacteria bacterium]|nr:hypothetical protein [Pseudomonadota bacterium]
MKRISLTVLTILILNISYSEELIFTPPTETDLVFRFQHFNRKSGKIFEYTNIHYKQFTAEGTEYFIEIIEKSKLNGEIFLTKKTWFESKSGRAVRSEEVDKSEEITIDSRYHKKSIQLSFLEKDKPKKMKIALKKNMVPADLIIYWLRKKIPLLLQGKELEFILFLPKLAFQLDEGPLPVDMAELDAKATVEKRGKMQIEGKTFSTLQILIEPASFWLSNMLPEDLSTFRFTYSSSPPYTLLGFNEENIKSELIEIR